MEVKAHERAHIAAGGHYVKSGARYNYQNGPDGRRYAIGGEVTIDTGEENTPEATIAKMQTVIRAALAPANPSGKDRSVAASAQKTAAEARQELNEQNIKELKEAKGTEENKTENDTISEKANQRHQTPSAIIHRIQDQQYAEVNLIYQYKGQFLYPQNTKSENSYPCMFRRSDFLIFYY